MQNLTNRNQHCLASLEPSTPSTASPGYPNTLEKQDSDLKSYLMMLVEEYKKDINNFFKEIQENTGKEEEALKEETQKSLKELQENTGKLVKAIKEGTQKSLKELQENTTKQVKELNKTIQYLKMEVETIKKKNHKERQLWR
jgi:predicted transcriptional regulator